MMPSPEGMVLMDSKIRRQILALESRLEIQIAVASSMVRAADQHSLDGRRTRKIKDALSDLLNELDAQASRLRGSGPQQ